MEAQGLARAALLLFAACGRVGFDGVSVGTDAPDADEIDALPDPSPGVTTIAGAGDFGLVDGVGDEARFHNPVNLTVGPDETIYLCDYTNNAIRAVTPSGVVTTVVADPGLDKVFGIAMASDGTLLVAIDGGELYSLDPATKTLRTVAVGIGTTRGILPLSATTAVLTSWSSHRIQTIDLSTGATTFVAGSDAGFMDATGAMAAFNRPTDIEAVGDGTFVVADLVNNRLRIVSPAGVVTTLTGSTNGFLDGPLASALLDGPTGLAVASDGTIYLSDRFNYRIRKIANGQITTIAGSGAQGADDSDDPLQATFFGMEGIALSRDEHYLYIADGSGGVDANPYHRIRRLTL